MLKSDLRGIEMFMEQSKFPVANALKSDLRGIEIMKNRTKWPRKNVLKSDLRGIEILIQFENTSPADG